MFLLGPGAVGSSTCSISLSDSDSTWREDSIGPGSPDGGDIISSVADASAKMIHGGGSPSGLVFCSTRLSKPRDNEKAEVGPVIGSSQLTSATSSPRADPRSKDGCDDTIEFFRGVGKGGSVDAVEPFELDSSVPSLLWGRVDNNVGCPKKEAELPRDFSRVPVFAIDKEVSRREGESYS